MMKRVSLVLLIIFYVGAGINHFIHPAAYFKIIPGYLSYPVLINYLSGAVEIIAGLLLIFFSTRKTAVYIVISLLVLFIPAHIYMIQVGWCTGSGYCFPSWVIWLRLFPLQFILMWWAWQHRK